MECCKTREELCCYIDGELDDLAAEQVKIHLAECADCREEVSVLRGLVAVSSDICEQEPPTTLKQAIMSAVKDCEQQTEHDEDMIVLMSAFVDGELPASDLDRVTKHLAVCSSCREQLSDIRSLTLTAHQIELAAPPNELRSCIAAAISEQSALHARISFSEWLKRITAPSTAKWAAGTAAASVIVLGLLIGSPNAIRQSEPAPRNDGRPVATASDPGPNKLQDQSIEVTAKSPKPASISPTHKPARRSTTYSSKVVAFADVADKKPAAHVSQAKPDVVRVRAEANHVKPASVEAKEPLPEVVDAESASKQDTMAVETEKVVEIKKPEPVDVAKVTAEEQENIRSWLQEAKARASSKKPARNTGITLLSKEF